MEAGKFANLRFIRTVIERNDGGGQKVLHCRDLVKGQGFALERHDAESKLHDLKGHGAANLLRFGEVRQLRGVRDIAVRRAERKQRVVLFGAHVDTAPNVGDILLTAGAETFDFNGVLDLDRGKDIGHSFLPLF